MMTIASIFKKSMRKTIAKGNVNFGHQIESVCDILYM